MMPDCRPWRDAGAGARRGRWRAGIAEIKVTPLVADGHVSASFAAPEAFTDDSREVVKSGAAR